jgi:hypothetical protein
LLLLFAAHLGLSEASFAAARPAPEWVRQIAPGTWAAVSLNTLADVNPARDPEANPNFPGSPPWVNNQRAVLDAWNGGALATGFGRKGALIIYGGGHADYYGNEVYAFDLETRLWQRLTNPYTTPAFPIDEGIWPDGTPSVPHTYDQVDYHPATNSLVVMRTQYHNLGGYNRPLVSMFSLDGLLPGDSTENRNLNRRNWRYSRTNDRNHATSGGWSAFDSTRDVFWVNGGAGAESFSSFDPRPAADGGRFGRFQNYPRRSEATCAVAAHDPVNDIVVFTTFRDTADAIAIDLNRPGDGQAGNVKLLQTGTPPDRQQSHGWEWSPARAAFVYYSRGAGVFELKQQGANWRTSEWKWTQLTSPDNVLIPASENTSGSNGVFSRFRIATFDDAEVALVVTQVNGPVYAFRIPGEIQRRVPGAPRSLSAN